MMQILDSNVLLAQVAERLPAKLRQHVVVIGSIATAWQFRDISGTASVATKDIDLLLRPAVDAVTTAVALGEQMLDAGWTPQFPHGRARGTAQMRDDELPALRLAPPNDDRGWMVELLGAPPVGQTERKRWRRFETSQGLFALPSFRYMPVAVFDAMPSPSGLRVARPACMALAHLLEHGEPDETPISGLPGEPPRFVKDVGRAVALWWLANRRQKDPLAEWRRLWNQSLGSIFGDDEEEQRSRARDGWCALDGYLRDAHRIAAASVLAPHGVTLESYTHAWNAMEDLLRVR